MNSNKYFKISLLLNVLLALIIIAIGLWYMNKKFNKTTTHQQYNIVMLGNSITAEADWALLLQRQDVYNRGIPGFTSSHHALLLEDYVLRLKPQLCFVMAGINDIQVGIPLSRIKSNFSDMLVRMEQAGITPVVQSVLYVVSNKEINNQVDSLNNFLQKYCLQHDIHYMDINTKLSNSSGLIPQYSTDGIHINQEAYKIWSTEVDKILDGAEPGFR